MDKLSFNKRIALTKKETASLIQTESLDKGGNVKSGYYSIKTIMHHLNQIMDKYDIDIDIIISGKVISCIWIDCLSEATRVIPIELKEIHEIERLAAMQNIIQSQGAVLTYYRRYAITNVLNLNATDLIENNPPQKPNKPVQKPTENQTIPKTVSEAQLKRLFAIMNKKGKTKEDIDKYLKAKKSWKIDSTKKLCKSQYDELVKKLETYPDIE